MFCECTRISRQFSYVIFQTRNMDKWCKRPFMSSRLEETSSMVISKTGAEIFPREKVSFNEAPTDRLTTTKKKTTSITIEKPWREKLIVIRACYAGTLLALTSATLTLEDESLSIITTTATPSVTTFSTVSMKLSDALLLSSSSSQSTTASSISSSSQSSSSSSSFSSSSSTLSLTGKQAIRKISNEEFPSDPVLHVEMEDKATQFLAWRIADASVQTESWETDIILNKFQASLMENQSTSQRLAHENNVLKQSLIEERTESGWLRLAAQQAEAKTYVETETQSVPQCLSAVTQTANL